MVSPASARQPFRHRTQHPPKAALNSPPSALLIFHPHCVLFAGTLGRVATHVHAAPAIVVGSRAPVRISGSASASLSTTAALPTAAPSEARAHAIPAGMPHALDAGDQPTVVCYLEPGSALARRLTTQIQRLDGPASDSAPVPPRPTPLPPAPWVQWAQSWVRLDDTHAHKLLALDVASAARCVDRLEHDLLASTVPAWTAAQDAHGHARVIEALGDIQNQVIYEHSGDEGRTSAVAAPACPPLSASRLRHLFAQGTGTTMRYYRVWRRLREASRLALSGQPLHQAALQAGFSDAAHFSRAFKSMFGLSPSSVLHAEHLQVIELASRQPNPPGTNPCRA